MADVQSCKLPEDLLYHVANNEWLRDMGDGTFQLGMTDIAQSMAGTVIHCRIKKVGKAVRGGKSLATVESGKWVGPVKSPFPCRVVEKNEEVEANAKLLNESPYRLGWIARIEPIDPADVATLVTGQIAIDGFAKYMADRDFEACVHCEAWDDA